MNLEQNSCAALYEKMIFFEDLSKREQREVEKHTNECPECNKHFNEISTIMHSLKGGQRSHPIADDLLARYSLYLANPAEPDYDSRKLTRPELRRVRKHVAGCPQCEGKVAKLRQEFGEIQQYLETTDIPGDLIVGQSSRALISVKDLKFVQVAKEFIKTWVFAPVPKFYPVAVGAVVVISLMIWVGPFFRGSDNPYSSLVSLEQEKILSLTRGSTSETLNKGLISYQEGNYQKAIQELEKAISENSTDPSLFYAHRLLGVTYLIEAKNGFWGRFKNFEINEVDKGIQHLQIAQSLSDSRGLDEDCNWYIAKAYLMKEDVKKAKGILQEIIKLRGRRYQDAKELIKEIENISRSN